MINFDKVHPRLNTNSVKWDTIAKTYKEENLLPLWVADMDFLAPEPVKKALEKAVAQGIYGYSTIPDSLLESIIDWQQRRHGIPSIKKRSFLIAVWSLVLHWRSKVIRKKEMPY